MTIRSGGIVSGLDTGAIIEALLQAERAPIFKLQGQRADFKVQLSKIGNLKAALGKLDQVASVLSTSAGILAFTATSTDQAQLTASATGGATAGSHQLQVLSLASAERDRSAAFASTTAEVKAGTLTIQVEGQDDVAVAISEGMSLTDVAAAINQSGARAVASVLFTGSVAYLDVVAMDSGYHGADPAAALHVLESYSGASGTELGLAEVSQASNAQFTLDGLTLSRRSNTVGDALAGVTLQLKAVGSSPATLDLSVDSDGVVASVGALVTAYNELMNLLSIELQVGAATARRGALAGDPTVRALRMSLASALAGVSGGTPANLAAAGITTQRDGTLAVDDATLRAAVSVAPAGLAGLFTDATEGASARLQAVADRFLDYVDGAFVAREHGLQRSMLALDGQIERLEARAARYEERLVRQFTALETALSALRSQESSLSAMLGGS